MSKSSNKKIPNKKPSTVDNSEPIQIASKSTKNTKIKTKSSQRREFIPRLLCFSNIDASTISPYYFIQNILGQEYTSGHYIFNVFIDNKDIEYKYKQILKKFVSPSIKINFYLKEITNINDHLIGLSNTEYQTYNTFLYIDGAGIYMSNYISSIINKYDSKYDILNIRFQNYLYNNQAYNYILNNKSIDILIKNQTQTTPNSWLTLIKNHKLKTHDIFDADNSILSGIKPEVTFVDTSSQNDAYQLMENEFFTLCMFEHHFWSSYIYLNKRNNRMYNIFNDDHGAFEIQDNTIKIKWDSWGDEIFYKKQLNNKTYYYSIRS
jgi:ribosomal protein S18